MFRGSPLAPRGFSLVEALVALVVFSIGVLGLVGGAALTARLLTRGRQAQAAAVFAVQRGEVLRASACARREPGTETLARGGRALATNSWTWEPGESGTYLLRVVTRFVTAPGRARVDTLELSVWCPD
jgi:prepilin-type N-terminal cleavage/methylation domain-containing protein